MKLQGADKKGGAYIQRHTTKMPVLFHFIGSLAVGFVIYLAIFKEHSDAFWFMVVNNSFIGIPYLITLFRILTRQEFIIEVKEDDDELQINYFLDKKIFKSLKFKFDDIKEWGVKKINNGIATVQKPYITDKNGKQHMITLGYIPLDLRVLRPAFLYAYVIEADITEALKGHVEKIGVEE